MQTKFFERGGKFYLIAYVDDLGQETIKSLPPREALNSDHIILVAPNKTMEINSKMLQEYFPVDESFIPLSRHKIDRNYGFVIEKKDFKNLLIRVPRKRMEDFSREDGERIKEIFLSKERKILDEIVWVYLVSDTNWVRINPYKFAGEIYGERTLELSREELKRLAYKRLRKNYRIRRDAKIMDASGIPFHIDFILGNETGVVCMEEVEEDKVELLEDLKIFPKFMIVTLHGKKFQSSKVEVKKITEL
jgi:hypothetical protein